MIYFICYVLFDVVLSYIRFHFMIIVYLVFYRIRPFILSCFLHIFDFIRFYVFHDYFYFIHGLCCILYVLYFTIYLVLLHVLFCFIFCEPAIFQASKLPTGDGGMRGAINNNLMIFSIYQNSVRMA